MVHWLAGNLGSLVLIVIEANMRRCQIAYTDHATDPSVLSGAGSVWIAYDKAAAWSKLGLIVLGLAIYVGIARMPSKSVLGKCRGEQEWESNVLQWLLGGLATLITIYFFLTNDWTQRIGKIPQLDFALRWFASWQPNLAGWSVNSNVIGGAIAALLPLQIAALFQNRKRGSGLVQLCLIGLSGLGLLMSESRGAWLALAFVLTAWATHPRGSFRPLGPKPIWAAIVFIVLLTIVVLLVATPLGEQLLEVQSNRLKVWRNSLDLASDYAFTGLGLGNFGHGLFQLCAASSRSSHLSCAQSVSRYLVGAWRPWIICHTRFNRSHFLAEPGDLSVGNPLQ